METTTTSAVREQESNFTNAIVHGDCTHVMQEIPAQSVDFILTDPPYLVNFRDRSGRSIANDCDASWLKPACTEAYRILKSNSFMVCCYGWSKVDLFFAAWQEAGFRPVGHIVFHKSYASKTNFLRYQHEQAFLLAKGSPKRPISPISDVLKFRYSGNELHPTQKPVSALIPLIKSFSREGDLVADPFCGSASTCAAAWLVGRRFLGIEMDEKYFRVATARIARVRERIAARQARPSPRFIAICAAPNSNPGWQDRKELPHRRIFFANATRDVWETLQEYELLRNLAAAKWCFHLSPQKSPQNS